MLRSCFSRLPCGEEKEVRILKTELFDNKSCQYYKKQRRSSCESPLFFISITASRATSAPSPGQLVADSEQPRHGIVPTFVKRRGEPVSLVHVIGTVNARLVFDERLDHLGSALEIYHVDALGARPTEPALGDVHRDGKPPPAFPTEYSRDGIVLEWVVRADTQGIKNQGFKFLPCHISISFDL